VSLSTWQLLRGSASGGGAMHDVHVPKEHLLKKSFGRIPFEELICKRAPVKNFCPCNGAPAVKLVPSYLYQKPF